MVEPEIDADFVEVATKPCRKRVDLCDLFRGSKDGLVHECIARGGCDLPVQDGAIPGNPDLKARYEVLVGAYNAHRLLPRAVKAVANDPVIPSEIRHASFAAPLSGFVRTFAIARTAAAGRIGFIGAFRAFCGGFRRRAAG